MKRKDIKLFATAFLQVAFVAANTYFIAQLEWTGIALCSFAISFLWTKNVKRIALSNIVDQLIYAVGAMCGGITGVGMSYYLTQLL